LTKNSAFSPWICLRSRQLSRLFTVAIFQHRCTHGLLSQHHSYDSTLLIKLNLFFTLAAAAVCVTFTDDGRNVFRPLAAVVMVRGHRGQQEQGMFRQCTMSGESWLCPADSTNQWTPCPCILGPGRL
jgi:hypothetical protein